jgi:manganese oxidase
MGNGKEAFAINYGSVAIGTEIWANRFNVGPVANAVDAKFEEFFLSSWVGGDPALLVDVPANATAPFTTGKPVDCSKLATTGTSQAGLVAQPEATVAFYPDDPSNVYHSYLNDRIKFRILHAGPTVTHVHYQHAHQWLRTPASSDSKLLDSQTITPGDAFTLEMIYGSGNCLHTWYRRSARAAATPRFRA